MGYEYHLYFQDQGRESVITALRVVPDTREGLSDGRLEFRPDPVAGKLPHAFAFVEPFGLYFCSNQEVGPPLLELVTATLRERFGAVTVESLDA